MILLFIILAPLFLYYFFKTLKFTYSLEGRDERGQQIQNISFRYSIPILPIGWLIVDSYHKYISELSLEFFRDTVWILIILMFIVQGAIISSLRKKL